MEIQNPKMQEENNWCILAAIENVLRHHGELHWNQKRIFQLWQQCTLGPVTFDLQSPTRVLPKTELGARFTFEFRSCSIDTACAVLKERAKRMAPTIVSCAVPGAPHCAHMRIVTAFEGDTITALDPADASHSTWAWDVLGPLLGDESRDVHMLLIDPR